MSACAFPGGKAIYPRELPPIFGNTAMSMLINTNPSIFTESAKMKKAGRPGFGDCPFSSEDLHRAFLLVKFHQRHMSAARKENNFYQSDEVGPVREARYFTREELEAAQIKKALGAEGLDPEAVHPMEQLAQAGDADAHDSDEDKRTFTQEEEDFEKGVGMIQNLTNQPKTDVVPDRAGLKEPRPPLTKAIQRMFCERQAKTVKVLYDEKWTEVEEGGDAEVRSQGALNDREKLNSRFMGWTIGAQSRKNCSSAVT